MTSKFGTPIKKYKIWESPDVLLSCQMKSTFWQQSFKCWRNLDWYYVGSILSTLTSNLNVCKELKILTKKNCKVSKRGKIFEGRLLLGHQLFFNRLSWQQSNSSRSHVDREACPALVFVYSYLLLYLCICICICLSKSLLATIQQQQKQWLIRR